MLWFEYTTSPNIYRSPPLVWLTIFLNHSITESASRQQRTQFAQRHRHTQKYTHTILSAMTHPLHTLNCLPHSHTPLARIFTHIVVALPLSFLVVQIGRKPLDWVSINLGIFVCIECAGLHRNLGVEYSKVRSIQLDTACWDEKLIKVWMHVHGVHTYSNYSVNLHNCDIFNSTSSTVTYTHNAGYTCARVIRWKNVDVRVMWPLLKAASKLRMHNHTPWTSSYTTHWHMFTRTWFDSYGYTRSSSLTMEIRNRRSCMKQMRPPIFSVLTLPSTIIRKYVSPECKVAHILFIKVNSGWTYLFIL